MEDGALHLLVGTILFRWYVFLFWGVGLWILGRQLGWMGAFVRFVEAYAIAYGCEYLSSIPGGWFPFGHYTYLPTTRMKEIWIGHLPLMDSLSFAFLMVASLGTMALFHGCSLKEGLLGPLTPARLYLWGQAVAAFVLIDVVIDPASLRGGRWFLGQIYYYPGGGGYFGVPLANFAGWFFVGVLIVASWRIPIFLRLQKAPEPFSVPVRVGPLFLYASVFLFNTGVAFYLKEWKLGGADILVGLIVYLIGRSVLFFRPALSGHRTVR